MDFNGFGMVFHVLRVPWGQRIDSLTMPRMSLKSDAGAQARIVLREPAWSSAEVSRAINDILLWWRSSLAFTQRLRECFRGRRDDIQ
jgi:hypothetical protein